LGLIQAAIGAVGGTLADQWKDFYTVPRNLPTTAVIFPAIRNNTDSGRGTNEEHSEDVITNGTKFVVPEGHVLITLEDGAISSIAAEPGGYIWDDENPQAKSVFSGGGLVESVIKQSWDRFKFGGRPGGQQKALYVNIQELPNNRFGTQTPIFWDDAFLGTQVGAVARGTYSLKGEDPILFLKSFVPSSVVQNGLIFDFTDANNQQASQLFSELVSVLAATFSAYSNETKQGTRISRIQNDALGFTSTLAREVEAAFDWTKTRGISIPRATLMAIDYDDDTKDLLKTVQRADALAGQRGNSNLQASVAEGIQSAGKTEGSAGILGIGIASGSIGLSNLQQPPLPQPDSQAGKPAMEESNLLSKLAELNQALSMGLINQQEFDSAKSKLLGI
jgi:membrane protease subunit (stomatin/prohibitin family)